MSNTNTIQNVSKITWQISGKELHSFLNAKNNKLFKSNAFYLSSSNGSAKFMLECYSNGMNKGEEGSVDLFLKILSLPEHVSDMTLCYVLQCNETNTAFTKIKTFNRETTNSCWPYNTLQLEELSNLKIITFECDVQIISVQYKKTKSVIGTVTNYFNPCKMERYSSFEWQIFGSEYDYFMACDNRKQLKSQSFGSKFFQLEIYPNGARPAQTGHTVVGLSLLCLPPLLSAAKLFYSFECVEANKEWSNVHNFNYKSSVKGWPVGLIQLDALHKVTSKQRQVTFKCNIEVLKIYNLQNEEIEKKDWHRFIVDNTKNFDDAHRSVHSNFHDDIYQKHAFLQKDAQINKLTQSILRLQQSMDLMQREVHFLRHSKSPPKHHHNHHWVEDTKRQKPQRQRQKHKKKRYAHPRSISNFDSLQVQMQKHSSQPFYPLNNSQSVEYKESKRKVTPRQNGRSKPRSKHLSIAGLYDFKKQQSKSKSKKMSPLQDLKEVEDINSYKKWYYDPYKRDNDDKKLKERRKKTDEGFVAQLRSFVQMDKMMKADCVQQLETNEIGLYDRKTEPIKDNESCSNESVKIHESDIEFNADEDIKEGIDENVNYRKKIKKINKKNKKKTKRFRRSQSEKKLNLYRLRPSKYEQYERKSSANSDGKKLKKWICGELGFPNEYFVVMMENGYDCIDIVVEMKESDLVQIGIENHKHRRKLLKEFARYNPFQRDTLGSFI